MLFSFFKPKWQNQKPEVRLRAIEEMSCDNPESNSILEQLAVADPDNGVRIAATSRLKNLELLQDILSRNTHDAVSQSASERLCTLIADAPDITLAQRLTAIKAVKHPNLLTHIILKSSEQELQLAALSELEDQDALASIIRNSALAQVRRQAAEKLSDPETIETLSKETQGKDKGTSRILRNKLNVLQEAQQQREALHARLESLCASLEQLATCEYFPQYGAKLNALCSEWDQLQADASDALTERANEAITTTRARLDQIQAAQEAERLAAAQLAERKRQQQEILDSLHKQTERLKEIAEEDQPATEAESVTLSETKERWATLAADTAQTKQFDKAVQRCEALIAARQALLQRIPEIESLAAQIDSLTSLKTEKLESLEKRCARLAKSIDWPETDKPLPIQQLLGYRTEIKNQLKERQAASKSQLNRFESALDELEASISAGQSKAADKQFKQVEQLSAALGKQRTAQLDHRLKQLSAQVQEMKEWQGYAVAPKKEALCAEMEALSESNLEPQQLANKIRELQQQWKLLDSTDSVHSHAIWKRFKQAADVAYKPCEEHFNSQKAVREKNLHNRHKLCEQLQNYKAGINWDEVNWKELEGLLKQAKRDWRDFSPVDRSPGKKVQTQFNNLITELESPLKAYRQENAGLKQKLIADVQALLDQEDLSTATDQVKEIQAEWRSIGPTFRSKEQALWQQFRELCNDVFDRYHQNRRDEHELKSSASLQVESICSELELAQETLCGLDKLNTLLTSANDLFESYADQISGNLNQRFQESILIVQSQRNALQQMNNDPRFQALQRKSVLCEQLEIALLEGDASQALTAVSGAWQEQTELPEAFAQTMETRFEQLSALSEQPKEALNDLLEGQELTLRQLCIRLEIALGQPSPVEDQALRMEYQMQRLQQALAQQEEALNLKAVKALRCEWLCVPFASHYPTLCQRFEGLINALR